MKKLYEIYLTEDFVKDTVWLKLFLRVGRLNGIFRKFKIKVKIENQLVRYFLEVNKEIPSILSDLPEFILKEINEEEFKMKFLKTFGIMTKRENNIIDLYDKFESKKQVKLKEAIISFRLINFHNYFSKTLVKFETQNKEMRFKKMLFNLPHKFFAIDFSEHSRFLYIQNKGRYLNLEKSMYLFENTMKDSILEVDTFPYLQTKSYLNLCNFDFDKHSLVVGGSGTGKSKMICSIISKILSNPEYKMKYKIVVIDPHSSMENDIGGLPKTSIFNFKTARKSINLFSNSNEDILGSSELMLSLFKNLIQDNYNSKLERVLRHSISTLLYNKMLSFANLRNFILNIEYRNKLLRNENIPVSIKEFFMQEFNELKTKSYQEAISPIVSFIDEVQILPAFSSSNENLIDLKEVIKNNSLSIFSLNIEALGERTTNTIVSLIMSQMLELIQNYTFEEHIIFVIDEVAIIENIVIKRFLSEARKYNLSLILAQQYFNQISTELQKAIFANCSNYYAFRVSREDAIILSGNLSMDIAVRNSHFARVRMITELANRECIVKLTSRDRIIPAFKCRTQDLISVPPPKEVEEEVINLPNLPKKPKNKFIVNTKITLKELMKTQSTGRRKITDG